MGRFIKIKRKNQCRKHRFRNIFEARRQADKHGMRAYPCNLCGGYHLTSQIFKKGDVI
jgi:hypothetical protein